MAILVIGVGIGREDMSCIIGGNDACRVPKIVIDKGGTCAIGTCEDCRSVQLIKGVGVRSLFCINRGEVASSIVAISYLGAIRIGDG